MPNNSDLAIQFLNRQSTFDKFLEFLKFYEYEGWARRKDHSFWNAYYLKFFLNDGDAEKDANHEVASEILKHYDLQEGCEVSAPHDKGTIQGVILKVGITENSFFVVIQDKKGNHFPIEVLPYIINLNSDKVRIVNQFKSEIQTETYEVICEGEKYFYIDYFENDKIVDSVLRDESGANVEDPILFEKIQQEID